MARYVEAIYTDLVGREIFRELLHDPGCGWPTAVRHLDGILYLLITEAGHRLVYRKAPNQHVRSIPAEGCLTTSVERQLSNN